MSAVWSFIGGLVIALLWPEGQMIGSNIFFWGLLCNYFIFSYLVKKDKIPWVFKNTNRH